MKKGFFITFIVAITLFCATCITYADVEDNVKLEQEGNDTPTTADRIYDDYTVMGDLSSGDFDYFKFTLKEERVVTIISATEKESAITALCDSEEYVILSATGEYTDGAYVSVLWATLEPGTYYIIMADTSESDFSNEYFFYFAYGDGVSVLDAPEIDIWNIATTGKIKLSWNAVDYAEKYRIERSIGNDDNYEYYTTTTGTSFTNTSTTAGKTYYYRVKAVGEGVESAWAYEYQTCDLARPEISISNVASSGKIKLSWNKVAGADRYEIQRSVGNDDNYEPYKTVTGTTFTNTSTTAGKTYYYRVKAIYDGKSSANSAWAYEYQTCDLARPKITISNVASSGKIKLKWDKVTGADRYEIQRSVGNDDNYKPYKTVTGTTFTNTSTTAGKTYYYRVKAIYDGKSSANSAWAYEYQTCDLARPEITVSGMKKPGKIVISWSKIADADRYYLYRASSKNGAYKYYDSTTSTRYTNSSVTKGKYYYYKVKAVCDGKSTANSAYSNMDYAWVR